jgi:hypothetical protein
MGVSNLAKPALLADLQQRFGQLRPLPASQSLFDLGQSYRCHGGWWDRARRSEIGAQ